MSPAAILWLSLGLAAIVVAHELTHVAIARAHGHRLVCVAVNIVGVAVVFEDTPSPRYWLLQVILPAVVTWSLSIALVFGLLGLFGPGLVWPSMPVPGNLFLSVSLVSLLTSGGDVAAFIAERRKPLWGDERVLRDLRLLRKLPSLVWFTPYGQRWRPAWQKLGEKPPTGPAA